MTGGPHTSQTRWRGIAATWGVAAAGVVGALVAARLFEQAVPQIHLQQRLTASSALVAARDVARTHQLPFPEGRTAVRFAEDDSLQLFLELASPGGKAALDTAAVGRDIALFRWTVRALTPGDVHETRVRLAPDGRVTGFWRRFAEADRRPELDSAAARALATEVLVNWLGKVRAEWTLVAASRAVEPTSARVNWSFTFEHRTRRVAGAPLRTDVDIAGDLPSGAREHVIIPETFARRYAAMRSSNELLAQFAALGFPLYGLIALVALYRAQRRGEARWRPAIAVAAVIAGLMAASMANDIPLSWFTYPTSAPPGVFLLQQALAALLVPLVFGAFLVVVLAGGESLAREAFPAQLDWWSAWRARGTPRLTRQVLAGYALCAVGLGYVAAFYAVTRSQLGWWVPSALLDDPNAIATPLPFISALANAVQAGVLEEVLFRAVPLSAVAILTRDRAWHRPAMALAVVGSALVFGFAHASYASWPAYSRGVELFAEAVLWGVVFLRVGLVPTVVCHFVFDLFLFGLFAMAGDAPAYRVTFVVVAAALFAPAILVVWSWWRRASLAPAWETVTFGAWLPSEVEDEAAAPSALGVRPAEVAVVTAAAPQTGRFDWRWVAVGAGALSLLVPRGARVAEPRFTVDRERAIAIADSVLRTRGATLAGLSATAEVLDGDDAEGARFFDHIEQPQLARTLSRSYRPLGGWGVRFDRREGTAAEKAEAWRLHLLPDGTPHDWRHLLPEDAERADVSREAARGAALSAVAQAGIDTASLRDAGVEEERRPKRRDLLFVFEDRSVAIPGGASARVRVRMAGGVPVGVARTIRLGEPWLRADAARQERRSALRLTVGIALLLVAFLLALRLSRRTPLVTDRLLSRRGALIVGGLALAVMLARGVSMLPAALAAWDNATPWASHQLAVALAILAQLFALVLPVSLWVSADAMRRRLGIPASADRGTTLWSGLALGALAFTSWQLAGWVRAFRETVEAPTTSLGLLWPAVAGGIDVLTGAGMTPLVIGIPAMLIAGLSLARGPRIGLIALGALAVAVPIGLDGGVGARMAPLVALLTIVLAHAWWGALARWGRDGAAAWVVGALVLAGLQQASGWAIGAHVNDRIAAVVGVVTAVLGVVAARRWLSFDGRVTYDR